MIQAYISRFHGASASLRRVGIEHWIDFGTLLGAMRDGRMISGDVDLDIDFWERDLPALLDLRSEFSTAYGLELLYSPRAGLARLVPQHPNVNLRTGFTAYKSCIKHCIPYLDLYPCKRMNKSILHIIPEYSFPSLFVSHLETSSFEGVAFPSPNNPIALLRHRYGKSWRIPLPRSAFQQRASALIEPFPRNLTCIAPGAFLTASADVPALSQLRAHFDRVIGAVLCDEDLKRSGTSNILPFASRMQNACSNPLCNKTVPCPPLARFKDELYSWDADFVAPLDPAFGPDLSNLDSEGLVYRIPQMTSVVTL